MLSFAPEDLIKLLLAVVVGGIIGFERELHSKAAGLRTITLITVGATLFTLLSAKSGDPNTARISSNIVTGVGFLGAGAIMFAEGKVKGLTTASSIWVAASLGMALGQGEYVLTGAATLLVVIVLGLFTRFDMLVDRMGSEGRTYEITYSAREGKDDELKALFRSCGIHIRQQKRLKQGDTFIVIWETDGRVRDHVCLAEKLLGDKDVRDLRY
jgi:putative Mg2+ transporter-C (MgtC) family protein